MYVFIFLAFFIHVLCSSIFRRRTSLSFSTSSTASSSLHVAFAVVRAYECVCVQCGPHCVASNYMLCAPLLISSHPLTDSRVNLFRCYFGIIVYAFFFLVPSLPPSLWLAIFVRSFSPPFRLRVPYSHDALSMVYGDVPMIYIYWAHEWGILFDLFIFLRFGPSVCFTHFRCFFFSIHLIRWSHCSVHNHARRARFVQAHWIQVTDVDYLLMPWRWLSEARC